MLLADWCGCDGGGAQSSQLSGEVCEEQLQALDAEEQCGRVCRLLLLAFGVLQAHLRHGPYFILRGGFMAWKRNAMREF